jgi:hypothetical protein
MTSRPQKCLLTSTNLTIKLLYLKKGKLEYMSCVKYLSLRKCVTDNSQHGLHFEGCLVYLNKFFWEGVRRFHHALKGVNDTKNIKNRSFRQIL